MRDILPMLTFQVQRYSTGLIDLEPLFVKLYGGRLSLMYTEKNFYQKTGFKTPSFRGFKCEDTPLS
jgi:hypothetical protein